MTNEMEINMREKPLNHTLHRKVKMSSKCIDKNLLKSVTSTPYVINQKKYTASSANNPLHIISQNILRIITSRRI